MATLNQDDWLALSALANWRITARGEVDDIGAWRGAAANSDKHSWGKPPSYFSLQTSFLVGWIVHRFPNLDPAPIQSIYGAVSAWHADHTAGRISAQNVLIATLEQALIVLSAVEAEIDSRNRNGEVDKDHAVNPSWNRDTGELRFRGTVVKRVKNLRQATNIMRVLQEFQEAGWPVRIDDPLPHPSSAERVNKTVESLNKNLSAIRFSADGTGQGFRWEAV